jgi:hypothetical protein
MPRNKATLFILMSWGVNPTIVSYNAGAVKAYNTSLVSFKQKKFLLAQNTPTKVQQRWRCSCKFKSRKVGSWV